MFKALFAKPVRTYRGQAMIPMRIEEWGDSMGCMVNTTNVRKGTVVELYQYPNGAFSHLLISGRKIGIYGMFTPVEQIISCCRAI